MKLIFLRALALLLIVLTVTTGARHGAPAALLTLFLSELLINNLRGYLPGHLYVYTGVGLGDIFIPQVYASIQPVNSPITSAFVQSGVCVNNPLLTAAANSGTKKIEVPLWNDLDSTVEENHSDDSTTIAAPLKVGTDNLNARNSYLNQVYGVADLAAELSKATPGQGDPMTRIKNRFGTYWLRRFQARVIGVCRGIFAENVANNSGDMVYDISQETTVGLSAANKISASAVLGAVFTMGDYFSMMKVIAMHSVVYHNLVSQQLIIFQKDATNTFQYPTYLGLRVVVDDGLPVIAGSTSGFKYLTVLFGDMALGYGEGSPHIPAEVYRLPLAGNGGGNEAIVERKTWMIHPTGFNWTDNTVVDGLSPTVAELATSANWARKFPRKLIPLAFLMTNG